MKWLYNLLFTLGLWVTAPYYFLRLRRRGNWKEGFGQRFGRYNAKVKQAVTNRRVIWLHAVSVGEVNICTHLIQSLEYYMPNIKIVVSTTTTTGMAELQRKLPSHIQKVYYPIDRRSYVCRAIAAVHPEAIVLVEAEIWPNFLWRARELRIPVFLVNARLSERSFRGYRWCRFLFRPLFAYFAGVSCQNEADAGRLRKLGCRPEAIRVVGNLKFDAAKLEERRLLDVSALLRQLGINGEARLLIGGSTHAGEEAILADLYLRLRQRHPNLFLVLVPRHFERGKEVGRELSARGLKFVYRSELSINSRYKAGDVECLLVNSTGELKYFYEHASVIFVGKSLSAQGGQNPIEPGILGKAMVFGPNMQNFDAIAKTFVSQKGALQVQDAAGLEAAIERVLTEPGLDRELGQNALRVVQENAGAIERTVEMMLDHFEDMIVRRPLSRSDKQ